MPTIHEEPEAAFAANNLTDSLGVALNATGDTLASAPADLDALGQQRYICPAHPDTNE